jgi:thioredoxin-dependent peroxiredoxin
LFSMKTAFFQAELSPGSPAPPFRLLDHQGYSVALDESAGKNGCVLLFFSGMNGSDRPFLENYARAHPQFKEAGIAVFGLSAVDWEALRQKVLTWELPFPLLFDPCARISRKYGAISIPRFMSGRMVFGIDAQRIIRVTGKNCRPDDVLLALQDSCE